MVGEMVHAQGHDFGSWGFMDLLVFKDLLAFLASLACRFGGFGLRKCGEGAYLSETCEC